MNLFCFRQTKKLKMEGSCSKLIYIGRETVTFKPPRLDFDIEISPPCDRTISLEIVNPKPLSPFNLFLEGSRVKKGLNTSSYLFCGMPGPLSLIFTSIFSLFELSSTIVFSA